jgi:hypothetical protein
VGGRGEDGRTLVLFSLALLDALALGEIEQLYSAQVTVPSRYVRRSAPG